MGWRSAAPDGAGGRRSLKRRLVIASIVPMLLILPLVSWISYRVALATASSAFDHALADDAVALASRAHVGDGGAVVVDLPAPAEAILRTDSEDQEFFSVHGPDGGLLAGDQGLTAVPALPGGEPVMSDAVWQGKPIRLASVAYATPGGTVQVAFGETLNKRDIVSSRILTAVAMPALLLGFAMLAAVYFGLGRGLAPLVALGDRIAARAPDDMATILESDVPKEAAPLIREINALIENLAATHAAQARFLAEAVHQLRTPLTGLVTQIDLALEEVPVSSRARLRWARDAAERLNTLVVDFLTLARTANDAGDVPSDMLMVDLVDLLEEVASTWHTLASERGVDLGFEAEPAEVVGVRWQLLELLGNLIDNALRHGAPQGTVTVRSGRDATGAAYLEVEDDGPGIAEAQRALVFDRFYRGSADVAGSGLGLAIVRSVAERHGASITLGSGAGGRGLRVRVDFAGAEG